MKTSAVLLASLTVAGSAGAQAIYAAPGGSLSPSVVTLGADLPRAVVGISTSTGSGSRDTLGLLVISVRRGSPAERAGIEEGSRIQSINGVNLRLARQDLGEPEAVRLMSQRLTRELDRLKVGDEVELRLYAAGQTRTAKVRTVDPDSLYDDDRSGGLERWGSRATLGVTLGTTGSRRDTLGVFVISVDAEGPAERAGIEEGARIASINGVDLRVAREDAGDNMLSAIRIGRLERELGRMKAGDVAELRVYQNGQSQTMRVTTVPQSELLNKGRRGGQVSSGPVTIIRSPDAATTTGGDAAASMRRAMEQAAVVAGRSLSLGGTIRW